MPFVEEKSYRPKLMFAGNKVRFMKLPNTGYKPTKECVYPVFVAMPLEPPDKDNKLVYYVGVYPTIKAFIKTCVKSGCPVTDCYFISHVELFGATINVASIDDELDEIGLVYMPSNPPKMMSDFFNYFQAYSTSRYKPYWDGRKLCVYLKKKVYEYNFESFRLRMFNSTHKEYARLKNHTTSSLKDEYKKEIIVDTSTTNTSPIRTVVPEHKKETVTSKVREELFDDVPIVPAKKKTPKSTPAPAPYSVIGPSHKDKKEHTKKEYVEKETRPREYKEASVKSDHPTVGYSLHRDFWPSINSIHIAIRKMERAFTVDEIKDICHNGKVCSSIQHGVDRDTCKVERFGKRIVLNYKSHVLITCMSVE